MEIEGAGGMFVLGCFDRPVTIYSQQVRALNLVWSLRRAKRMSGETRVLVVGAGAAGLTLACAALRTGAHVALVDKGLHLATFGASAQRLIHPNVNAWPEEGWNETGARLPILRWWAQSAASLAKYFRNAWQDYENKFEGKHDLRAHCVVRQVRRQKDRWEAALLDAGSGKETTERYDIIVLATGPGFERDLERYGSGSYWKERGWQERQKKAEPHFVVSGTGDGGLIDALMFRTFDHDNKKPLNHDQVVVLFNKHQARLAGEIRRIEGHADSADPRWLEEQYAQLDCPLLDAALADTTRPWTVTIVGRHLLSKSAAPIHRVLVSRLLNLEENREDPSGLRFIRGELVGVTDEPRAAVVKTAEGNLCSVPCDTLVVRHGTEAMRCGDCRCERPRCPVELGRFLRDVASFSDEQRQRVCEAMQRHGLEDRNRVPMYPVDDPLWSDPIERDDPQCPVSERHKHAADLFEFLHGHVLEHLDELPDAFGCDPAEDDIQLDATRGALPSVPGWMTRRLRSNAPFLGNDDSDRTVPPVDTALELAIYIDRAFSTFLDDAEPWTRDAIRSLERSGSIAASGRAVVPCRAVRAAQPHKLEASFNHLRVLQSFEKVSYRKLESGRAPPRLAACITDPCSVALVHQDRGSDILAACPLGQTGLAQQLEKSTNSLRWLCIGESAASCRLLGPAGEDLLIVHRGHIGIADFPWGRLGCVTPEDFALNTVPVRLVDALGVDLVLVSWHDDALTPEAEKLASLLEPPTLTVAPNRAYFAGRGDPIPMESSEIIHDFRINQVELSILDST